MLALRNSRKMVAGTYSVSFLFFLTNKFLKMAAGTYFWCLFCCFLIQQAKNWWILCQF